MEAKEDSTLATRWSRLNRLDKQKDESSWEWFIARYRPYVASLLRRRLGASSGDDATDQFWGHLVEKEILQKADRSKRFRTFLNGVIRYYVLEWRRSVGSVDRLQDDPVAIDDSVEDLEAHVWAATLVANALKFLRNDDARSHSILTAFYGLGTEEKRDASAIAREHGMKPNAVHQAIRRAKVGFAGILDREIRETVCTAADFDDEKRILLNALSGDVRLAIGR